MTQYDATTHAAEIAAALNLRKVGKGWRGVCPVCRDKNPSLSLRVSDDGTRALIHCFAGCDFPALAAKAREQGAPYPDSAPAWRGLTDAELSEARTILALAEADRDAGRTLSAEDAATVARAQDTVIAGEVERLARLRPIEREREAKAAAEGLGCTWRTLLKQANECARQLNADAEPCKDADTIIFNEPEPWPNLIRSADVLLNDIARVILQHVVTSAEAADAAALWILHTHCFRAFGYTPRFNIRSPIRGCGKSTFLAVIGAMVAKPKSAENVTTAVMFRLVDQYAPTVLLDEYDTFLPGNEELRGILNAGCVPGGTVLRCEGDDNELREFKVFAPAALAGIHGLPPTLHDRSIVVTLQRALPGDKRASFDSTTQETPTRLKRMAMRWAADNFEALKGQRPVLPVEAVNRLADKWRPPFAIAELAGGDWRERARCAFAALNAEELYNEDLAVVLLGDIRDVFAERGDPKVLYSHEIVDALTARQDRPWKKMRDREPLDENKLSFFLKPFGVRPKERRRDGVKARGYLHDDLAPVFASYLPPLASNSAADSVAV